MPEAEGLTDTPSIHPDPDPPQLDEDCLSEHVCPECRVGKHQNCDRGAWCVRRDEPTECACALASHGEAPLNAHHEGTDS